MRGYVTLLILGLSASLTVRAEDCDQDKAQSRWKEVEESQVVYGAGFIKNIPTFSVNETAWKKMSYNARVALVKTFECAVVGPGKAFAKVTVVERGGRKLADWDAVSRSLDVK